jgi:hypothetical protein
MDYSSVADKRSPLTRLEDSPTSPANPRSETATAAERKRG